MAQKHDENRFKLKPRPPRARGQLRLDRLPSRLSGPLVPELGLDAPSALSKHRPGARIGRGLAAGQLAGAAIGLRARRVTIKARVVRLKTTTAAAIWAHLRYISRDGVGVDGEAALPYSRDQDQVHLQEFQDRGANDRHQFRFIVAPEDATELEDLRAFTRHLMATMEGDLGTRLDWVAVDHWDTEQPHTHIVLRGKDAGGADLVIAGDYIAHGMRVRAREVATEWLGPRSDLEIQASLRREVEQERWTSLDRELNARSQDGQIDLGTSVSSAGELRHRALLLHRLRTLQRLELAHEVPSGRWHMREDAEATLRARGERGDIIRTMQRSFGSQGRDLHIFDAAKSGSPLVGRIAAKGLADELSDQAFVVVDGVDGRGHYVALATGVDVSRLPIGGIIEVRSTGPRAVDRNVVESSINGLYHTASHISGLRADGRSPEEAEEIVASHVRRLEALRRGGVVQRISEGLWEVPKDLMERGAEYDRRRRQPLHGFVRI